MEKRAVNQLTLDGVFIKRFESLDQASTETGVNSTSICLCCRGKYKKTKYKKREYKHKIKSAGGYKWEYDNTYLKLKINPFDKFLTDENYQDVDFESEFIYGNEFQLLEEQYDDFRVFKFDDTNSRYFSQYIKFDDKVYLHLNYEDVNIEGSLFTKPKPRPTNKIELILPSNIPTEKINSFKVSYWVNKKPKTKAKRVKTQIEKIKVPKPVVPKEPDLAKISIKRGDYYKNRTNRIIEDQPKPIIQKKPDLGKITAQKINPYDAVKKETIVLTQIPNPYRSRATLASITGTLINKVKSYLDDRDDEIVSHINSLTEDQIELVKMSNQNIRSEYPISTSTKKQTTNGVEISFIEMSDYDCGWYSMPRKSYMFTAHDCHNFPIEALGSITGGVFRDTYGLGMSILGRFGKKSVGVVRYEKTIELLKEAGHIII